MAAGATDIVVLYDGVCGLCDRVTHFLVVRDVKSEFRYAALQGDFAKTILARHGRDPAKVDTVVVATDVGTPGERLLTKARAIFHLLARIGGPWGVLAAVLGILPTFLLDFGYDLVARVRYRVWGKFDTCPVPPPEVRERFIEVG
ncbi:MAG: DCC1-like thiol-disulfide oxidoreductase family protein [Polyangiaceae bacterium]